MGLIIPVLFISCEKDLITYEGTEGIYFGVQWGPEHGDSTVWAYQHYTSVEFINILGDEQTVKLRVMATGRVKDYDREFSIKVNKDSTDAVVDVDFDKLESSYMIPAGSLFVDIPVTVKRTEALQSQTKTLGVNLVPNEHFTLAIPTWYPVSPHWATSGDRIFNATYHQVLISDFITRPAIWFGQANNGVEAGLLGVFTEKKFRLICAINNLVYNDFANATSMPTARVNVINQVMKTYLQTEYDAGRPVLEADGRLMWVMNVSWTSTVGVPYKP
ncbi:DUF4843 domain-containing protein [Sphingobacterium nematocida]|uniref:DUF4843 domain-containing protein n=1 Tax=Sphingobacterium nematocida TaxID=1513896 RepID=UPI0015911E56|nr:DUF4843 domain-containing protein [Sphingobacterium nematocida]